jgi:hypothetical protein
VGREGGGARREGGRAGGRDGGRGRGREGGRRAREGLTRHHVIREKRREEKKVTDNAVQFIIYNNITRHCCTALLCSALTWLDMKQLSAPAAMKLSLLFSFERLQDSRTSSRVLKAVWLVSAACGLRAGRNTFTLLLEVAARKPSAGSHTHTSIHTHTHTR